jgi:HAD superfamily hydrolase (TIGR01450 family)
VTIPVLTGLSELAANYRLIVCDLWGVVHNGRRAFPEALAALDGFRASGTIVHLVSNAPRPSATIATQLRKLGVEDRFYDDLVTSGDITIASLTGQGPFGAGGQAGPGLPELAGAAFVHIGPERDLPLLRELRCRHLDGFDATQIAAADFILCSGLFDDEADTPDNYRELLAMAVERDLLMICANPDLVVMRGDDSIPCAGAVAASYEAMGGRVQYFGKPHREVYQSCLDLWREKSLLRGQNGMIDPGQVLAIGDSLHTDIPGADLMGFHSILIAGGIHGEEFGVVEGALPSVHAVEKACDSRGLTPNAVMTAMVW